MKNSSKLTICLITALLAAPPTSWANYIYTYTGNNFNEFDDAGPAGYLTPDQPLTTDNYITFWFSSQTLVSGDSTTNLGFSVTEWEFSDGITTTNSNDISADPGIVIQIIETDTESIPTKWHIWAAIQPNQWGGSSYIYTYRQSDPIISGDGSLYQNHPEWGGVYPVAARNYDMPGTWTITSTVPIPAAAWLFCSGLLGLIGVARKKVDQY